MSKFVFFFFSYTLWSKVKNFELLIESCFGQMYNITIGRGGFKYEEVEG
jgi:hypothetical protein